MTDRESTKRPLERALAHYHRLLGEILQQLVADSEGGEAEIVWLDDMRAHQIHQDAPNEYARAVYLLRDLSRHQQALGELTEVEEEVHGLYAEQGIDSKALVTPTIRTGVQRVRLQKVSTFVGMNSTGAATRGTLTQLRNNLLRDLEAEGNAQMTVSTATRERLSETERALEALKETENVRVRWPATRHHAILHPLDLDLESERVYVTKPGLIVQGPGVTVSAADDPRRPRSDRVRLEPMAVVDGRQYYDLEKWNEALASKRKPREGRG